MAIFPIHHPLVFTFGLLGNIISFMVYLVPLMTFYRIYKKKSTEGFQSIPYVVALFSSMLWMYYAFVKTGAPLLITINSFGCVVETLYIVMYITYAPSKARVFTTKLLVFLNFGVFSLILLVTIVLVKGTTRVHVLGWVCVAFSVSVFAAPLSIVRQVIRTKSVEFMPFPLSFFLMLSAVMWFSYGFFLKDIYIALPNIIGFVFGVLQMVLYAIYNKDPIIEEMKLPQEIFYVVQLGTLEKVDDCVIDIQPVDCEHNMDVNHQRLHEQVDRNQPLEIKLSEFEAQIPAIAIEAQIPAITFEAHTPAIAIEA